ISAGDGMVVRSALPGAVSRPSAEPAVGLAGVAVFISLLGAVVPIYVLTRPEPNLAWYLLALVSAGIGVLGFTTTLAIFPVAVVLIAARNDLSVSKRLAWIVAWAVGVVTLCFCLIVARGEGVPWAGASESAIYVLNYVGAGVAHFAGRLAPFLTVLALLTSVHAAIRLRGSPQSRPWLSLMAFVLGCALLTAFGRAGYFGANQAFVVRYISFASLFWLGWVGLMVLAWRDAPPIWPWVMRPLLCGVLLLALVNAAHAPRLAAAVHERARGYAERIRAHYPQVDGETMQAAYEFRADVARERLRLLRERDFAPF